MLSDGWDGKLNDVERPAFDNQGNSEVLLIGTVQLPSIQSNCIPATSDSILYNSLLLTIYMLNSSF